jgi:hypothetical protein
MLEETRSDTALCFALCLNLCCRRAAPGYRSLIELSVIEKPA